MWHAGHAGEGFMMMPTSSWERGRTPFSRGPEKLVVNLRHLECEVAERHGEGVQLHLKCLESLKV